MTRDELKKKIRNTLLGESPFDDSEEMMKLILKDIQSDMDKEIYSTLNDTIRDSIYSKK